MKKITLLLFIVTGLFAFDCPLEIFERLKKVSCPKTLVQKTQKEDIKDVEIFLKELDSIGIAKVVYFDVLKALNETSDIESYIYKKNFSDLEETQIFAELLKLKTLKKEEKYQNYLNKIDANNSKWCVLTKKGE
ncbi:hypothetical protein ACNSOL_12055 (plasmid) [Aliarcobacter lanthieri]|uniref:hypothetical protein n=1 Tax=Aliarcobacter lanthieri TaxID=1355374 RepID=UPI003AACDF78